MKTKKLKWIGLAAGTSIAALMIGCGRPDYTGTYTGSETMNTSSTTGYSTTSAITSAVTLQLSQNGNNTLTGNYINQSQGISGLLYAQVNDNNTLTGVSMSIAQSSQVPVVQYSPTPGYPYPNPYPNSSGSLCWTGQYTGSLISSADASTLTGQFTLPANASNQYCQQQQIIRYITVTRQN